MQLHSQDQSAMQDELAPILALDGVTKTFPGVKALSEVSLKLYPGQVTALVGENGAGKSTVVKILTGIYQPDGGSILVDGMQIQFPTPQTAADAGITAIHQETVLFDELSVAENIFIGHAPRGRFGLIDWSETEFDEIFRIPDRYTVFRDGQLIGDGLIKDVSEATLVTMMVGRDVNQIYPNRNSNIGEDILTVEGYSHPTEFADIGFALRKGEILGFYGLVGAGRSEFMQSLFGITKPSSGGVRVDGTEVVISSPADAVSNGIVYVPEDRGKQGAITDLPIFQNVTLPSLGRTSKNGFLRLAEEFKLAREYTERLDLRAASLDTNAGKLSGGNQQKVVIAKWLATQPKVIILDEPTKGIDIGSKQLFMNSWQSLPAKAWPSSWSVRKFRKFSACLTALS